MMRLWARSRGLRAIACGSDAFDGVSGAPPSTAAVKVVARFGVGQTDATAAPPRSSAVGGCPQAQCQTRRRPRRPEKAQIARCRLWRGTSTDNRVDGATAAARPRPPPPPPPPRRPPQASPPSAAASPSAGGQQRHVDRRRRPPPAPPPASSEQAAAAGVDFFATGEAGRASARSCSRRGPGREAPGLGHPRRAKVPGFRDRHEFRRKTLSSCGPSLQLRSHRPSTTRPLGGEGEGFIHRRRPAFRRARALLSW